jgi:hypothetical protein
MALAPTREAGYGAAQSAAFNAWLGLSNDDWRSTYDAYKSGRAWDSKINEISAFDQDAAQRLRQAASGYNSNPWGARYDFADIYNAAIKGREQRQADEVSQQAIAELQRQQAAAEAAAARSRAWTANMPHQNRQNENLPEIVSAGTADDKSQSLEGVGNIGGRVRRRGRGALSSNLGIRV